MERALNLEGIRLALGEGGMLPSAEELQERLANAEIQLFLGRTEISDDLLAAGWYLHGVASARESLDLYPIERQRRAHQISAHIFDLALQATEWGYAEQLQLTFAAQVGYLRGDLDPNSAALYRRLPPRRTGLASSHGIVSVEIGTALLALDRHTLFSRVQDELRPEARQLREQLGVDDLIDTTYGSAARVVEAVYEMIVHLTYNRPERLGRARNLLNDAIAAPFALGDLDSRWVAAHLRDLIDDLGSSSVWGVLPPTVPSVAGTAMTLGDPPVLALWPPQVRLFSGMPSPLDPAVRRLILSLPTSTGKTLVAQFLITAHVAQGLGSVCVVVPTHSLARELRRDLDRRLSVLAKAAEDAGPPGPPLAPGPPDRVVVMTPEKLAALLRHDPGGVLSEFSLFVIDEAHLTGDRERGWVLESTLSFLHQQTVDTPHRFVLLSAALGNRAHFAAWIHPGADQPLEVHEDWRGPRRVHAIFTTVANDQDARIEEPTRRNALARRIRPLHGQITVRTGSGRGHVQLTTAQPIGRLVEKQSPRGGWKYDQQRTTPHYLMRVFVAQHLGQHGPVLIIEGTKQNAQRFATALAAELEEDPDSGPLVSLASTRLGEQHPLVGTLKRGVGFHHAALPEDIQAELEDAVRSGRLRYLVSTTTLIEGINLPVRSVLIGTRGYRTADGFVETLDAPKLLNAVGRAGRAGKESEGWIVLAVDGRFHPRQFAELEHQDEQLVVISRLATEEALHALDVFEDLVRRGEDAVLQYAGREVSDFISHVWLVATAIEELTRDFQSGALEAIEHTLAWQQLDEATRDRWKQVAARAFIAFSQAEPDRRRRWARTGTSIPTAARLEQLVDDILPSLDNVGDPSDPLAVFGVIAAGNRLETMLELPEGSFRPFRPSRRSPRTDTIPVNLVALTEDWLRGASLPEIAERHLASIPDEDFRYEQLSEFATQILEHLLPWVIATLVSWLNERRGPGLEPISPDLSAYVRYGVHTPTALALMRGGIRSRRLVQAVSAHAPEDPSTLKQWLADMDLPTWRELFDASPSELADLLTFTRAEDSQITARVLSGEPVPIPLVRNADPQPGAFQIRPLEEAPPERPGVWQEESLIGIVRARYQDGLNRLMATGLPLQLDLETEEDGYRLTIRVRDPDAEPGWFTR